MYKELWEDSMRMCDRLSKQNESLMLKICDLRKLKGGRQNEKTNNSS